MTATSFMDLRFIIGIAKNATVGKKATPKFIESGFIKNEEDLKNMSKLLELKKDEIDLIKLIDIDGCSFTSVAECIGVTKQCVNQKYEQLYVKVYNRLNPNNKIKSNKK
jgi:predicted DNA-binding protein (UPF0251 family)